ncbi:hypothetical protein D3C81_1039360 [compost metagenome]
MKPFLQAGQQINPPLVHERLVDPQLTHIREKFAQNSFCIFASELLQRLHPLLLREGGQRVIGIPRFDIPGINDLSRPKIEPFVSQATRPLIQPGDAGRPGLFTVNGQRHRQPQQSPNRLLQGAPLLMRNPRLASGLSLDKDRKLAFLKCGDHGVLANGVEILLRHLRQAGNCRFPRARRLPAGEAVYAAERQRVGTGDFPPFQLAERGGELQPPYGVFFMEQFLQQFSFGHLDRFIF